MADRELKRDDDDDCLRAERGQIGAEERRKCDCLVDRVKTDRCGRFESFEGPAVLKV